MDRAKLLPYEMRGTSRIFDLPFGGEKVKCGFWKERGAVCIEEAKDRRGWGSPRHNTHCEFEKQRR